MYSCQKELTSDQENLYERFYKLPKDASASLIDMASSIRKLENQLNIAHSVVARNSLPVWSNSISIDTKDSPNMVSVNSRGAIETGTGSFRTVITGVADINTNEITGYIKFIRANDTVRIRYVEKSTVLSNYQIATSKPEKDKAIQDLFFFAYFEKEINQVEKLKLKNIAITSNSASSSIDALMQACITRLCHSWGYNYTAADGTVVAVSGWECYYVANNCGGGGGGGGGVSFQNCGSGGPCPGSGGFGSGSGGSLTGGSGPNGSNYWGPPIYSTLEGTGSGNNPRDSLIRDSIIKEVFRKEMEDFKNVFDSAYALDNLYHIEYGCFFGSLHNTKVIKDFHTDSLEYMFIPNWKQPNLFDSCYGTFHTHRETSVDERMIQDVDDVYLLRKFLVDPTKKGNYYPKCYVHCGDKIYVVVVEDVIKASAFFDNHNQKNLAKTNANDIDPEPPNPVIGTRRQRSINSFKAIFGQSGVCGIGLYESVPPSNLNFIKLN